MRKVDGGRILLGLLIVAVGGFLTLISLQLYSYGIMGLWPLALIVPGIIMLSLAVVLNPSTETRTPLRPLHQEDYPEQMHHHGPLVW